MKTSPLSLAGLGSAILLLSLGAGSASTPPAAPTAPAAPAAPAAAPAPAPAPAFASGEESVQTTYAGRDALKKKDYPTAVSLFEKGLKGVPDQPDVIFDMARAYALSGNTQGAIDQLDRLATLGFGDRAAKATAFDGIRDDPRFKKVEAKIAAACVPVGKSRPGFTLADAKMVPGGMDYDPGQKLFYIGSFAQNKIVAVTLDGKAHDFTTTGQDGLGNVLALRVDVERRQLLATSAALGPEGKGTGLFRYDLKTGKLIQKVRFDDGGAEGAQLNDVIPTPSGDILTSEVITGTLHRLPKGGDKFEAILPAKTFVYPNVLSLAPDGRHLYVANVLGLAWVDLVTHKVETLPHPKEASLVGLDGILRDGDRFIATQNGVSPPRLLEIRLSPKGDAVTGFRVLEARTPELRFPTTGAIVGRSFYYIADSPFDLAGPDGSIPEDKLKPSNIRIFDIG